MPWGKRGDKKKKRARQTSKIFKGDIRLEYRTEIFKQWLGISIPLFD